MRTGQRLFAGCVDAVDDDATLERGVFVCDGDRDPAPFGGNGRACGDCHVPGDAFAISLERIATLPRDHPLFFPGLDEDPVSGMVQFGDAFRRQPHPVFVIFDFFRDPDQHRSPPFDLLVKSQPPKPKLVKPRRFLAHRHGARMGWGMG